MKKFLKKIAEQRILLIAMGKDKKDCTLQEVNRVLATSTWSCEKTVIEWAIKNLSLIDKICPPNFYKEKQKLFSNILK